MTVLNTQARLEVIILSRLFLWLQGTKHFTPFQHERYISAFGRVVGHLHRSQSVFQKETKIMKILSFTCAVAGEAEPWRARPRPSSEDLTSLTSSHSASSSTLLVLTAEGSSHTEAVGARKAWRLTSTRWHEITRRSGDFLVSLACLAQSFSERAESGLNEKTLGNFFRRWGWFLAVHPETDTRLRLQLARTEREHFIDH